MAHGQCPCPPSPCPCCTSVACSSCNQLAERPPSPPYCGVLLELRLSAAASLRIQLYHALSRIHGTLALSVTLVTRGCHARPWTLWDTTAPSPCSKARRLLTRSASLGCTGLRSPIPFRRGLALLIKADCCIYLGSGASGSGHNLLSSTMLRDFRWS
jgi:hypothetical protein